MQNPPTPPHQSRRRTARSLVLVVALVLGLAYQVTPASAHWNGTGQLIASMAVYPYNYNSTWQVPLDRALSQWNATASPAYIYKYSNSGSSVTAASYSDTWQGYYQRCGDSCYYIRMNSRTISAQATNFANLVTDVLVHEYGHALNLAHNSVNPSIMNESRARNSMIAPQAHDIADVNAYY